MVERWHLDLAATALFAGLVVAGVDRWCGHRSARFTLGVAGLVGAVLGGWGHPRAWPWLVGAAILAVWPDEATPAHPLGNWTVALAALSLAGVWAAVPDTEPPLAAGCALVPLGVTRLATRRAVGPPGTAVLVVAVLGAVWVGSAGWGAALASACAVAMILAAPLAVGFCGSGVRASDRRILVGAHVLVVLVVPRMVMRLDVRWATTGAALAFAALVVVARLVGSPGKRVEADIE